VAYVWSAIGELVRTNPPRARRAIVEALELSGGNVRRAAHVLVIERRTLQRWLWRLSLWSEVDRIRAAAAAAYAERRRAQTGRDDGRARPGFRGVRRDVA